MKRALFIVIFIFLWPSLFSDIPKLVLSQRQVCDLEMLMNGGFSPLEGFLGQEDYESVVVHCRLKNGTLWPIPIVLAVEDARVEEFRGHNEILLLNDQNLPLARLQIQGIYKPDLIWECRHVLGTTDMNHPYVKELLSHPHVHYIGGRVEKIQLPPHYDFPALRLTPDQTKQLFKEKGWTTVIAFQTRNPLHQAHVTLMQRAMASVGMDSKLLLHPVVGVTQEGDIDPITRVRCYQKLLQHFPEESVALALLPLSMRMAGPREALWHALIRQNYGCTHFIVGRDHAGPSTRTREGTPFYPLYAAQEFLLNFQEELAIRILPAQETVYVPQLECHLSREEVPEGMEVLTLSGTEWRRRLVKGEAIPSWFSYPEILEELRAAFQKGQGFCLYFTGLSGAGKSTLARAVQERLAAVDPLHRTITLLDGDEIRMHLSQELGFTGKDRSIQVRRIGYLSSLIVRHGGICIVANIAPYEADRLANRALISAFGPYLEVYVATDLATCAARDPKGLYRQVRAGTLTHFTGIDDPYEVPTHPEITVSGIGDIGPIIDFILEQVCRHVTL